jgi:hypothetical protein
MIAFPSRLFDISIGVGVVLCGVSWLYWLRQIALEANETLPAGEQVRWPSLIEAPKPAFRILRLWEHHARQFPASKKRAYAAISLLLFFLVGIVGVTASILVIVQP